MGKKIAYGFNKTIAANTTDPLIRILNFKGKIRQIRYQFVPVSSNFLRISVSKGWSDKYSDNTQIFPAITPEGQGYVDGQDFGDTVDLNIPFESGERIIVQAVNPDTTNTRSLKVTVEVEKEE